MLDASDARRRWLGLFCLVLSFGMLVWGQTVLKPHLEGVGYLIYWALCFLFTVGAVCIALLDMRALRAKTRRQHFELLEKTLDEVEEDSQKKRTQGKPRRSRNKPRRS